jgi:hypothetical protein
MKRWAKFAGRRYLAQIEDDGLRKKWLLRISCNNAAPDAFWLLAEQAMRFPLAVLLLALAATTAMAQSDPRSSTGQIGPLAAGPFQALGNVIRNPDAAPPRRPRSNPPPSQPQPPPSIFPRGVLVNPEATQSQTPQR